MKLIRRIRQFIADIRQALNDPYTCLSPEGKKMWQEFEQWAAEKDSKNAQK